MIYSFAANEGSEDGLLDEEAFETEGLDRGSRDFLDAAIRDYNGLFATSFDTSDGKFENYYKDLSQRLKNRELDLVIVVNMFPLRRKDFQGAAGAHAARGVELHPAQFPDQDDHQASRPDRGRASLELFLRRH